jgi:uncharacterized iron-regulated protein
MSTCMRQRVWGSAFCCLLLALHAGCAGVTRREVAERGAGSAALFGQFQACDGRTGRPMSWAQVVRRCGRADVILFGEQHADPVCNQLEAQLFASLAARQRRVALAMEFFEADTQASLDAYLRGRIDEPAYREQTRQGRAYVLSHRPLLELCRAAHIPVIAANAPRRLVRAYRTSDREYDAFRAELDPAEQRWLPAGNELLAGPYEERFLAMMREHGPFGPGAQPASAPATASSPTTLPTTEPVAETQPTATTAPVSQPAADAPTEESAERFFLAQLLWDEAMADALADYRARYPTYRVMLIVGGFHVAHDGGTLLKLRLRRPHDRIVTIVYGSTTDGRFPFDGEDRDAGDIVLYGIAPPEEASPMPSERPIPLPGPESTATAPAAAPTECPSAAVPAKM